MKDTHEQRALRLQKIKKAKDYDYQKALQYELDLQWKESAEDQEYLKEKYDTED